MEENEVGAIEVFRESASLLRSVFGVAAASMKEATSGWDFPAALDALREAKAECDELR